MMNKNVLGEKFKRELGIRDGDGISWGKLFRWKPSAAVVAAGFVFLLVLTLIPLLRLSIYTMPWYDDLSYGGNVKDTIQSGANLLDVLKTACDEAKNVWHTWQGTYSSVFLMALMPGVWGYQYYFIGPVVLIILPVLGIFALGGGDSKGCMWIWAGVYSCHAGCRFRDRVDVRSRGKTRFLLV